MGPRNLLAVVGLEGKSVWQREPLFSSYLFSVKPFHGGVYAADVLYQSRWSNDCSLFSSL